MLSAEMFLYNPKLSKPVHMGWRYGPVKAVIIRSKQFIANELRGFNLPISTRQFEHWSCSFLDVWCQHVNTIAMHIGPTVSRFRRVFVLSGISIQRIRKKPSEVKQWNNNTDPASNLASACDCVSYYTRISKKTMCSARSSQQMAPSSRISRRLQLKRITSNPYHCVSALCFLIMKLRNGIGTVQFSLRPQL